MKLKTMYLCTQCGHESAKWYGKCPACDSWNSFSEESVQQQPKNRAAQSANQGQAAQAQLSETPVHIDKVQEGADCEVRYSSGINELDRVLGGGIVSGSLVLVGGDPGIGKSTLLLQMCKTVQCDDAGTGEPQYGAGIFYISGEESERQVKMRARRLGVSGGHLYVLSQVNAQRIVSTVYKYRPRIVIIDSIQTMYIDELSSSPGSVTQVRECTSLFMRCAKELGVSFFIVGHVNKDGAIAGPKVMEHMVDAVLYFEGDHKYAFRILRATKNRFGSTNEIGVFEMCGEGLREVANPSQVFLEGRPQSVSGTGVTCLMEGSRPLLAEVQALVAKTPFTAPRRMSSGVDYNKMALLLAVLEKRVGLNFGVYDAYVNVVGGLRMDEPACDLAVILSLASSLKDFVIPPDVVLIGEVGLAGEVRPVSAIAQRVDEARRMGFTRCVVPHKNGLQESDTAGVKILPVKSVIQAMILLEKE